MNSRLIPTATYIDEIAVALGLNQSQLRLDMNSAATTLAIQRTSALASALGLLGTPALVVGRTMVQGEITQSQLERLIENERHLQSPKVVLTSHLYLSQASHWLDELNTRIYRFSNSLNKNLHSKPTN